MLKKKNLLDAFSPPEGFKAEVGIATTMSHEPEALNLVMETFTGRSHYQLKAIDRKIRLVLIYDNSSPVVDISKVGSLFPVRLTDKERLLHAKVAILKFSKGDSFIFRLVVLTGNFTMASLNRQIEMVWFQDFEGNQSSKTLKQAGEFLKKLLQDHCLLRGEVKDTVDRFLQTIAERKEGRDGPRFIHSLKTPLMEQVLAQFKKRKKQRYLHNHVALGTPFLQEDLKGSFVVQEFLDQLYHGRVLSQDSCCFLQTLEGNLSEDLGKWYGKGDFSVHGTEGTNRSLHSKFIIMSNERSDNLYDTCIYIGSGNLTINGFKVARNIEAGIVFDSPDPIPSRELDDSLFLSERKEVEDFETTTQILEDEKKAVDVFNLAVLSATIDGNFLEVLFGAELDFAPLKIFSGNCELGYFVEYPGPSAKLDIPENIEIIESITVQTLNGDKYPVLVFEKDGRTRKIDVEKGPFEEVFSLLKTYPGVDNNPEDDEMDEAPTVRGFLGEVDEEPIAKRRTFALYNLSELVEHIAKENQNVNESTVSEWINTLEFTLIDCLCDEDKKQLASVGAEKILFLKNDNFSPPLKKEFLAEYFSTIDTIKANWEAI